MWKVSLSFSGPYSVVRMRENTDQKSSEHGDFSRSVTIIPFLVNVLFHTPSKTNIQMGQYNIHITANHIIYTTNANILYLLLILILMHSIFPSIDDHYAHFRLYITNTTLTIQN